jgi:hypothetical protein
MRPDMPLLALLFFLFFVKISVGVYLTKEECAHSGSPYTEPKIVLEFKSSSVYRSSLGEIKKNDFVVHHRIAEKFCRERAAFKQHKKCSWADYYLVLDELRTPFVNLYDPGLDPVGVALADIQRKGKSGASYQDRCEFMENPTAEKLYDHVVNNKPVIIKGGASDWPAVKLWSDDYLVEAAGSATVSKTQS